jgi:dihydroorotate dehydrogenase
VKYTALANVKKMRELLVDDIDVVGAGGVFSGQGEHSSFSYISHIMIFTY